MQPIKFRFFVYGADLRPVPLKPGVALYARAYVSEYSHRDFRWDPISHNWVESDYLSRLASRGDPDLDNLDEKELPVGIPYPEL